MLELIASNSAAIAGGGLIGYGLGSIIFSDLIVRWGQLQDIRTLGSGNPGATNMLRTGSRRGAALTLLLDLGKGTLAVLLAQHWFGQAGAQTAAIFAVVGHVFPVWSGFKGGKGVATYFGAILVLYWPAWIAGCALWLTIAGLTARASAASLLSAAGMVVILAIADNPPTAAAAFVMTAIVWFRHRANIFRLMSGTEPKIELGKRASDPAERKDQ